MQAAAELVLRTYGGHVPWDSMDDLLKLPGVGPKLAKLLFVIRNQMLRMEDEEELPKRPRQVVSDSDEDAASRVP